MANDFSSDSSCKALWSFENGALTTDSKGSNTLTAVGTPTSDTTDFKEGSGSAAFDASPYYKIVDSALPTGFPLKSDDTIKKVTYCFWVYLNARDWVALISKGNASYGSWFGMAGGGQLDVDWNYNGSGNYERWNSSIYLSTGRWYHIALLMDGINKTAKWRVFDSVAVSVTNDNHTFSNALFVEDSSLDFSLAATTRGIPLNGNLDEFVVFDRLLADAEIDEIRAGTYPQDPIQKVGGAGLQVVYQKTPEAQVGGAGLQVVYSVHYPPDGCVSETTCAEPEAVVPADPPDDCSSETTCEDIAGPPDNCSSETACEDIAAAPANCSSETTCEELAYPSPDKCSSETTCQEAMIPLDPCTSLTTCEEILLPHVDGCSSETTCGEPEGGAPDSLMSITTVQTIPFNYGRGMFLIF